MDQRAKAEGIENDAKVTQIKIHGAGGDVVDSQEEETKAFAAAEEHRAVEPTEAPMDPGVPAVQDVEGIDDPNFRSYGKEHFLPLKKLGSGSFGDVYLVRDRNSGKLYAMKTLSKRKILG